MPRMKRVQPRNALFHAVSRVAHKEFFFDEKERDIIVDEMRRVAAFSGVDVISYCIMSNHIHMLLWIDRPENLERWLGCRDLALSDPSEFIPDGSMFKWRGVLVDANEAAEAQALRNMSVLERYEMDGDELLRRISILYERNPNKFSELKDLWSKMTPGERSTEMERYLTRMYDVSFFMKTLKQNISQSYNSRHGHAGTMWEGRFRTTIIERSIEAMSTLSTYIDLNPARAGIVGHPSQYRWSSFAAAISGVPVCRNGYSFIYRTSSWEEARELHETCLSARLAASGPGDDVKEDKFFMSGGVVGSRAFVSDFVKANPDCFPSGRKSSPASLRIGGKTLNVLRRIQVF